MNKTTPANYFHSVLRGCVSRGNPGNACPILRQQNVDGAKVKVIIRCLK